MGLSILGTLPISLICFSHLRICQHDPEYPEHPECADEKAPLRMMAFKADVKAGRLDVPPSQLGVSECTLRAGGAHISAIFDPEQRTKADKNPECFGEWSGRKITTDYFNGN